MKKILVVVLVLLLGMTGAVAAATIQLPSTGQVTCYDSGGAQIACSGTGQDGDTQAGASLPAPRFTPDYYGLTVLDNLTGLMWTLDSRTPDEFPRICASVERLENWEDALTYVACLNSINFLGYNDWRLPNRNELRSLIVDNSTSVPALPADYPFINVETDGTPYRYWSSTACFPFLIGTGPVDASTGLAWIIDMWDGSETCGDMLLADVNRFAWPVRGGQTNGLPDLAYPANLPATGQVACYDSGGVQIACSGTGQDGDIQAGVAWPDPRFTVRYCNAAGPCPDPSVDCDGDPTNDVVIDNLTGLIWARVPDNTHGTWTEALNYANGLTTCGYTNWRLPNINEMESMVNNGQFDTAAWLDAEPPLPPAYFIGVESYLHWTSTTHRTDRTQAMVVDLWDGSVENYPKSEDFYAWPVRFSGYQLSVAKTGTGTGTVTSVPPGINCGIDCKEIYPEGTQVTLTAQADPGFIFKGWSGGCTGTGTCTITMNSDTIVTAMFSTCKYTLTPTAATFAPSGGTINVSVVASGLPSCPAPSVSSTSAWITAQLVKFQNNSGTVSVAVARSDSSRTRIGSVTIGTATFTAKQKGRLCPLPTLTPSSAQFDFLGGSGSFTVSFPAKAPVDCGWVAKRNPVKQWINIGTEGGDKISGVGNGTVSYSVNFNTKGSDRQGRINVILNQNTTLVAPFQIYQSY